MFQYLSLNNTLQLPGYLNLISKALVLSLNLPYLSFNTTVPNFLHAYEHFKNSHTDNSHYDLRTES